MRVLACQVCKESEAKPAFWRLTRHKSRNDLSYTRRPSGQPRARNRQKRLLDCPCQKSRVYPPSLTSQPTKQRDDEGEINEDPDSAAPPATCQPGTLARLGKEATVPVQPASRGPRTLACTSGKGFRLSG